MMREIIMLCLKRRITNDQIDELEQKINAWVAKYER